MAATGQKQLVKPQSVFWCSLHRGSGRVFVVLVFLASLIPTTRRRLYVEVWVNRSTGTLVRKTNGQDKDTVVRARQIPPRARRVPGVVRSIFSFGIDAPGARKAKRKPSNCCTLPEKMHKKVSLSVLTSTRVGRSERFHATNFTQHSPYFTTRYSLHPRPGLFRRGGINPSIHGMPPPVGPSWPTYRGSSKTVLAPARNSTSMSRSRGITPSLATCATFPPPKKVSNRQKRDLVVGGRCFQGVVLEDAP